MRTVTPLVASAVFGSWVSPSIVASLSPEDAKQHIGEIVTVCGVVASAKYEANAQSQPTLLDLGNRIRMPSSPRFVYGDNRAKFGNPETSLRGKRICMMGKISDYTGFRGFPDVVE
jgi:hypothetical protein